ncbi:MAG: type III pantothenate kinase [Bacteriovoracaceae bacterium]
MKHSLISLDFGNSHPHAGLFRKEEGKWELLEVVPLHELASKAQVHDISPHNAQLILSEVKQYEEELFNLQSQGYLLTRIKDYWRGDRFAGMPVHYSKTLGEDRLINAFWTYKNLKKPTLIIDAGTYLTMDVVTPEGFIGGYIIPSYEKYLTTFGDGENLRDTPLSESFNFELPHTTDEAMSGGYHAFCAMAEKLIDKYKLETIIITGGRDNLWKEWSQTQSSSQVIIAPHFIHQALVYWMSTQVELL